MQFGEIKSLIFDYGGTLDTNARHWARVLWEGYVKAGIPVSEAGFRVAYVHGERTLARQRIIMPQDDFRVVLMKKVDIETRFLVDEGRWGADDGERKRLSDAVADYCYEYARRTVAHSREVLERLRPYYGMVLVSNFYGNIGTILRDFRLDCFAHVIESAVVGVRKPDPAIYRLGVDATGCLPGEVLVVGDSYDKDVVPAHTVGCATAWLKGEGWTADEPDGSLADCIITDLSDLLKYLNHD